MVDSKNSDIAISRICVHILVAFYICDNYFLLYRFSITPSELFSGVITLHSSRTLPFLTTTKVTGADCNILDNKSGQWTWDTSAKIDRSGSSCYCVILPPSGENHRMNDPDYTSIHLTPNSDLIEIGYYLTEMTIFLFYINNRFSFSMFNDG